MYIHVPVQPPNPPSAKAKEVGAKVAELVRILRQEDPEIGRTDVEQGLTLATAELRRELGGGTAVAPLVMLGLALMFGVGIFTYFLFQRGGGQQSVVWIALSLGMMVMMLILFLVLRRAKG
ncbi:MAG: hypothetical protein ACYTG5_03555 [Planctomycetota bacterium]|jgi:hypothetical protein